MPRDASGNMTLPVGNPVVSGTAISSSVQNATMADIAAEIQDSLSRSGKGGMLVPFQNADGTVGAPGITFTNEATSGWFRNAAGDIRAAVLGVWRLACNALGVLINGDLTVDGDLDVTGALTLAGTLSRANLPAVGQQVSGASGTFSSTAAGATDITNATVTITTTGRPVALVLQCAGDTDTSRIYVGVNGGATPIVVQGKFRMVRSGTAAATYEWLVAAAGSASVSLGVEVPPGVIQHIDFPAAGTYTYKLQVLCAADTIVAVEHCKLIAYEL